MDKIDFDNLWEKRDGIVVEPFEKILENSLDTLKTSIIGITGSNLIWMEIVPTLISVLGGIATLVYMFFKIKNEIMYAKDKRKGSR